MISLVLAVDSGLFVYGVGGSVTGAAYVLMVAVLKYTYRANHPTGSFPRWFIICVTALTMIALAILILLYQFAM